MAFFCRGSGKAGLRTPRGRTEQREGLRGERGKGLMEGRGGRGGKLGWASEGDDAYFGPCAEAEGKHDGSDAVGDVEDLVALAVESCPFLVDVGYR